jgi:hypothetical protein
VPVDPHVLAWWLSEAEVNDHSKSPTEHRMNAVVWLAKATNTPSPRENVLVSMVVRSLARRLSSAGVEKQPIGRVHVRALLTRSAELCRSGASGANISDVSGYCHVRGSSQV